MTEEVAETPPPPKEAGTGSLRNFRRPDKVKSTESAEKTPENNETPPPSEAVVPEVAEKPKKGQKRKKSFEPHPDIPAEFLQEPRRERSKRGAATKAALQISMNIMHQASNVNEQLEEPMQNGVRRGKKVQPNEEILSSSPVKWKAGPRCTKVAKVKPGPRSKRRRNFQLEDLYLDQPGIDELPMTSSYEKKLKLMKKPKNFKKEKLKACVPVLDLKKARNPSVKAAYEIAHENNLKAIEADKGVNNLVTVTYQKPKVTNTFKHKPDSQRVVLNDSTKNSNSPGSAITAQTTPNRPAALAPKVPDPLKPPPITNYMSVKIETLMNCLEKMYHNHLPLNAFTSRFPNARAKAMLTLMLDGHRATCETCTNILEEANVGVFHGDEDKLKMDLSGLGPAIPANAPIVDLSQYPDDVAAMKKLLVEKDAKIKALEKRVEALNKEVKPDEVDKLDLVEMLDGVNEPTMDKYGGKFLKTAGYRMVDLRLLRMALEICQNCHHNKMTLAEMSPEIEGNQEDVVTRLAFVCTVCGPKAIFPTSPFSKTYPTNYSLNKLLLPLLGPSSYFHLSQFLQHNPDAPQEILTSGTFSHQKPQLLVSVDHAFFDFTRPFDPPLPTDPDTNLAQGAQQVTTANPDVAKIDLLKLKPMAEIKAPPSINLPALRPIEPNSVPEMTDKPTNGSSNGSLVTRKIKACPELPPGCRITAVAPGTKLVSKFVKYSTTQKTNLAVGCYRVKEPKKDQERILIIRDEKDKGGGDNPVRVTDLASDNRQVHVAANHINSGLEDGEVIQSNPGAPKKNNAKNNSKNNSKSNSKNKNKRKSPDSEDSEIEDDIVEDEALSDITYSDDSDDQDWGKKKKKKNNNGKGGKKKK